MATNRPDPGDFLEMAQRMLRELFTEPRGDAEPWAAATRSPLESTERLSPEERRENLTFALATRAVEALEDLALNVAAIRQRLERTDADAREARRDTEGRSPDASDAPGD
jgi:hypothetical protein